MRKQIRTAIVVSILVMVAWVTLNGIGHYLKLTQPRSKDPCIANLKMISGAKDTWALQYQKTSNDTPVWSDLIGGYKSLSDEPKCYKGGTYTLGTVGQNPTCTVAGHSL